MIIGIGTDIQEIKRIENILIKYDQLVIGEIYSREEWTSIFNSKTPYLKATILFSMKESVTKAMGTGFRGCKFSDIVVEFGDKINIKILPNNLYEYKHANFHCTFSYSESLVYTTVILERKHA